VSLSSGAQWQDTKVEVHRSSNYNAPNTFFVDGSDYNFTASVFSFSHANGWKFGDNFFFTDVSIIDNEFAEGNKVQLYGEFSPRISIFKIAGAESGDWVINDLGVVGTIEFPSSDFNYLVGLGASFNIPGFAFFHLNGYVRNDPSLEGVTFQVGSAWNLPFDLGPVAFLFDGFFDWAGEEGDDNASSAMNFHMQPALFLDAGSIFKKPGHIYVGSEVIYWNNKYGIEGFDEFAPQVTLRWNF